MKKNKNNINMTREEVLDLITRGGLLKIKYKNRIIEYIDGEKVFYDGVFHNQQNVYGVYFNSKYNKYAFFITGEDRGGIVDYFRSYNTEEDAYTAMYEHIILLFRAYNS